jgi:hypothetical protein
VSRRGSDGFCAAGGANRRSQNRGRSPKSALAKRFESLGGEFFLGRLSDLESASAEAARPAAFFIPAIATKR